jgi:hypothetical protein
MFENEDTLDDFIEPLPYEGPFCVHEQTYNDGGSAVWVAKQKPDGRPGRWLLRVHSDCDHGPKLAQVIVDLMNDHWEACQEEGNE